MDKDEFEAIKGATVEETAALRLRALGLTEDRLGEVDYLVALREQVRSLELATDISSLSPPRSLWKRLSEGGSPARRSPPDHGVAVALPPDWGGCERCHGAGWVPTWYGERGVAKDPVVCPVCQPRDGIARGAGIGARYWGANLDTLTVRPGNEDACAYARDWDGTTSVVLASRALPTDDAWGTGKTHIACAMLFGQLYAMKSAKFVTVIDFLEGVKRLFGDGAQAEAYVDRMAALPILCLDDLGKEQDTPWAMTKLYQLLDARWSAKRVTVITTNLRSLAEVQEQLGGAIASRLRAYDWVSVGGTDLRGNDARA